MVQEASLLDDEDWTLADVEILCLYGGPDDEPSDLRWFWTSVDPLDFQDIEEQEALFILSRNRTKRIHSLS